MKVQVRGVKLYRSKGKTYCYHRATGKRILAEPGTGAFFAELASVDRLKSSQQPHKGTLGALLANYRASSAFERLADRTKADYGRMISWLAPLDEMPLAEITPPFARQLRDRAHTSGGFRFSNYVLSVLSAALSWGAEYGQIAENPIKGKVKKTPRPKGMPYKNRPWSSAEREAVLQNAPFHLKIPLSIMRWTGLRTGDALAMPRTSYDGTAIEIRTGKTGQLVWLPCPRPLRAILDEAITRNPRATTFAVNSDGMPWTGNGFRASLAKFLAKLQQRGIIRSGLSPHGLRHSVAIDLRELGFDERAIADFLGQAEIETARSYARGADLKNKMSAIVKKLDT